MRSRKVGAIRVRATRSLRVGAALFGALVLVNILAYQSAHTGSNPDLRFSPSHLAAMRLLLGGERIQESVEREASDFGGVFGGAAAPADSGGASGDTSVFTSRPSPVGRVGQPYRYSPRAAATLTNFRLEARNEADGSAPSWLIIDPGSGALSGTPDATGTYDVALSASLDDGRMVVQRFTLWVDDRLLLLGSDDDGRDIALLLFQASRSTVIPATVAVIIAVGMGVLLGALSGFSGGAASQALGGLTATIQSVPGLLLIALAGRLAGWNLLVMMAAVGLVMLPETASGVRELVERFRRRDFVEAARELGMRDSEILWREIIWHNGRRFIASRTFQAFSFAVLAEVTLSFLGFTDSQTPSVGRLLLAGRENEFRLTMMVPALIYLLVVLSSFALLERGLVQRWSRRR